MFELIKTLYAYNSWAVAKLLDALEQLTPEELAAPGCSGHGSIRDTLAHGGGLLHARPDPVEAIQLLNDVRGFAEKVWTLADPLVGIENAAAR